MLRQTPSLFIVFFTEMNSLLKMPASCPTCYLHHSIYASPCTPLSVLIQNPFYFSKKIQNEFKNEMYSKATAYNVLWLQSLSATRRTTRVKAADVVFLKTAEVRATLEMLLNDPSVTNDTKARIRGILERSCHP